MEAGDEKQTILHVNASLTDTSVTARVADAMLNHLTHHYHRRVSEEGAANLSGRPGDVVNVETVNVWSKSLPRFDLETIQRVSRARQGSQYPEDLAALLPIQTLATQILRADVLLITVPIWNFSIPFTLKQYLDCSIQAGLTFHCADEDGPTRPYFTGKPLIVISSSGGKAPPPEQDYVYPYLSRLFAMCGFDESYHVPIEGLASVLNKEESYRNAVSAANAVADTVVKNHKLRLARNLANAA